MQTKTSQNMLLLAYKTCNNKSNHSFQIVSKHVEFFSPKHITCFFPPKCVKTRQYFFPPKCVKTWRFLETVKQEQQQQQSHSQDCSTSLLVVKNFFQWPNLALKIPSPLRFFWSLLSLRVFWTEIGQKWKNWPNSENFWRKWNLFIW